MVLVSLMQKAVEFKLLANAEVSSDCVDGQIGWPARLADEGACADPARIA